MAARGVALTSRLHTAQRQRLAMTPSLRQSLQVLSMRISGVRRLARELAEDNPYLEADLPVLPDASLAGAGAEAGAIDFDQFRHDAVHPVALSQHVMDQIGVIIRDPDDRALALALADHLSPAGWLDPEAMNTLAMNALAGGEPAGAESGRAEALLAQLQTMEPAGLFARNLSECLALQLKDRGELTAQAAAVLAHLEVMTAGVEALAAAAGLDEDDVLAVLARLKRCDPKPGAAFLYDDGDMFRPDLIITSAGDGYDVAVNTALMPSLSVRADVAPNDGAPDDGAPLDDGDEAGALLLKQAQAEVQALRRSIRHREENLLAAGGILINRQINYLRQGEAGLTAFSMSALAEVMGVHKSTISRLVEGKLVQTPRGMVPMSAFFSPGVTQPDGGVMASRAIMARLRVHIDAMIAADDHPMTDARLMAKLAEDGIIIARRTVAKYRREIVDTPRHRGHPHLRHPHHGHPGARNG